MKRSNVLKLREPIWRDVEGGDGLRVCIQPSEAKLLDAFPINEKLICQKAFTNFEGYTEDDGTPVRNSLQSRLELFDVQIVRNEVASGLRESQESIEQGEDSAASD